MKLGFLGLLIWMLSMTFILTGYVKNIVKLCRNDFESPYKSEIIRGVGVIVPIVGTCTGYMELEE